MFQILDRIVGVIFIFGGAHVLFLVYGPLPKDQKKQEKLQLFRKNYCTMMKIFTPIIIITGIYFIIGRS